MVMPVVDERHLQVNGYARKVCWIFFNHEFTALWRELEGTYKAILLPDAKRQAFQDALYAFLAQEDLIFDGQVPGRGGDYCE